MTPLPSARSCIIGLPERGKPYIARRLQSYLSFFHGAEVQIFNLRDYEKATAGSDENADALLHDLRVFMGRENQTAANNMKVAKQGHQRATSSGADDAGLSAVARTASADGDGSLEEKSTGTTSGTDVMLVDNKDPRRKNVDSGKVQLFSGGEPT